MGYLRRWGVRGRAACGSSCAPPPGVAVPPGGGGTPPLPRAGWRAGAPAARRPGGGVGAERGGGGGAAIPCPPVPGGWAPPLGILVQPGLPGSRGRWVRHGRLPAGQCGGGGGWRSLCHGLLPPALPGWTPRLAASPAHSWVPPSRRGPRRRRRAAGRQRVMQECVGGRLGALGARLRSPLLWRPPLGCRGPLGGARGPHPSDRLGRGRGGGKGRGEGGLPSVAPWSPGAAPRLSRGGGLVDPVPGGGPPTGGAYPSPAPLRPQGARPPCRSSLGSHAPFAVAAWRRPAGGGGGGLLSAGGGCSVQRSAVSGLRGSGPPLALVAPVLSPTGDGARPFAAPYDGGVWVEGPGSAGGGVPLSPPILALIAWVGVARSSPASSLV